MTDSETFLIQINGATMELPAGCSIERLLELAGMRSQLVAVEVNGEIVPQANHPQHRVESGDIIEIVTLVGGG
jgi:sulfur carrier protein